MSQRPKTQHARFASHPRWLPAVLLTMLVGLASCQKAAEPEFHEVDKSRSGLDGEPFVAGLANSSSNPAASSTSDQTPSASRLLAVMINRPESTYFLKSMGPAEQMESVETPFRQLTESLKFNSGKPISWTVPENWTEKEGGAAFRLATLTGPNGAEIAVTSLTPGQDLLMNINRWQGQIGLNPISQNEIDVERLTIDGQEVILYDQQGTGVSNSMTPPFAGGAATSRPAAASAASGATPTTASNDDVPLDLPAAENGWKELEASGSKLVRREMSTENGNVYFELLKFPAGPQFPMMINVWAPTVGATEPTAEQFNKNVRSIPVGSMQGESFLLPLDDNDAKEALRVVRLELGADAWYFKWYGPADLIKGMDSDISDFLKNVTVPSP